MDIENIQNTGDQAAIPAPQEPQQETNDGTAPATESQEQTAPEGTPATEQQDGAAASDTTPAASQEPFLVARYLKEDKPLTRAEAKDWAEKGMHYESIYNELDYIAAQSNTDVKTLVNGMRKQMEDNYRAGLVEKLGEDNDTIDKLMKVYRDEQKEKYDRLVSERATAAETKMSDRLSNEYLELKKLIGDTVPAYNELPESVKKNAAEGMNLTTAFLLYQHNEQIKIDAAKETAEAAANASAGSMKSEPNANKSADEQFLAGLWGK